MSNDAELLLRAAAARANAHAPYSRFCVGAALRAEDGSVHVGCNVENASYGLTVCAERNAIAAAVAAGARRFTELAVVSPGGVTPCGACRQVLREFGAHLRIVLADPEGKIRATTLAELLPESFGPDSLGSAK